MNSIRYALASIFYHKKYSFFLGMISIGTIFILSTILNIIDLEQEINKQVKDWLNFSDYYSNYDRTIHFYTLLYLFFFILLICLLSASLNHFSKRKEKELIKWRIMGFSDKFIIRQIVLENILPVLIGCLFMSLFLLVFQNSYTHFVLLAKLILSEFLGIKNFPLFSSTSNIESTINISLNYEQTLFVSTQVKELSSQTIMVATFKSSCLLLILVATLNILIAYHSIQKSKKIFRR